MGREEEQEEKIRGVSANHNLFSILYAAPPPPAPGHPILSLIPLHIRACLRGPGQRPGLRRSPPDRLMPVFQSNIVCPRLPRSRSDQARSTQTRQGMI